MATTKETLKKARLPQSIFVPDPHRKADEEIVLQAVELKAVVDGAIHLATVNCRLVVVHFETA